MATITVTIDHGGQNIFSRTSSPSDAELDALVAAWQSDANASQGSTASYLQVLNFIVAQWLKLKSPSAG